MKHYPTFDEQLAEAEKLGLKDLKRHASVSTDNRHECRSCFCCAALVVLRRRQAQVPK